MQIALLSQLPCIWGRDCCIAGSQLVDWPDEKGPEGAAQQLGVPTASELLHATAARMVPTPAHPTAPTLTETTQEARGDATDTLDGTRPSVCGVSYIFPSSLLPFRKSPWVP